MGGASEDLIRQIYETRKMDANGVIIFDYAHTTPVYTSTLMASAFNSMKETKSQIAQTQKKRGYFATKRKKQKLNEKSHNNN